MNVSMGPNVTLDYPHHLMMGHTPESIIQVVFVALLLLVTFAGNCLVLLTFFYCKELRNTTNYFLISLSCADFLTAILAMPLWLALKITRLWTLGQAVLQAWSCLDMICGTASIWSLCAVSLDRALAVSIPLKHMVYFTSKCVKTAILGIWVYAVSLALLMLSDWKQRGVLIPCFSFFIPLIIIIASYIQIFLVKTRTTTTLHRCSGVKFRRDIRAAKQMIVIIGAFIACWIGFSVVNLLHALGYTQYISFLINDIVKSLTYVNSCFNPILYWCINPKFKRGARLVLERICGIKNQGRTGSGGDGSFASTRFHQLSTDLSRMTIRKYDTQLQDTRTKNLVSKMPRVQSSSSLEETPDWISAV